VLDNSGNGNDGEAHNVQLVPGKEGNALHFGAEGSYLKLPPSDKIIGTSPKEGTIEFWVKPDMDPEELPDSTPAPYNFRTYYETLVLLKKKSGNILPDGCNEISLVLFKASPGKGYLRGKVVPGDSPKRFVRIDSPLKKGVWTHIAMIWTSDKLSLYVDGELAAENTGEFSTVEIDSYPGYVGRFGATQFHGTIDELRIVSNAVNIDEE